jgi:hypothetical protein
LPSLAHHLYQMTLVCLLPCSKSLLFFNNIT